jgi:hypothetical protein
MQSYLATPNSCRKSSRRRLQKSPPSKRKVSKRNLPSWELYLPKTWGGGASPKGASNKKENQSVKGARSVVAGATEASAATGTGTHTRSWYEGGRSKTPSHNHHNQVNKGQQNHQFNRQAEAAENYSNGDNGGNGRRHSRPRSRNRNYGDARRNNRSSRAYNARLRQPMGLLQTQVFQTDTMPLCI